MFSSRWCRPAHSTVPEDALVYVVVIVLLFPVAVAMRVARGLKGRWGDSQEELLPGERPIYYPVSATKLVLSSLAIAHSRVTAQGQISVPATYSYL